MGILDATEILIQRFFQNVRDLYPSPNNGQHVLSLALWSFQADLEAGETFITADCWHERCGEFLSHQEQLLKACRLSALDGLIIYRCHPTGETRHKFLRV